MSKKLTAAVGFTLGKVLIIPVCKVTKILSLPGAVTMFVGRGKPPKFPVN
jgi:hypothetical protein